MKIQSLLLLTALSAQALAQNPPPPPGDQPPRPPGEGPRRGDGDRPPHEGGGRREGERRPDGEPRRGGPGEPMRRDGEGRGEGGRFFPAAPEQMRPYLGVVTSPAPAAVAAQAGVPEGFGLVVDDVLPDSPAKSAGLEKFDVLTKFDDQKLVDAVQLAALVTAAGKDASVAITLVRRGQEQKVTVKLAEKMLPARPTGGPMPELHDLWRRYGEPARRSFEPGGAMNERAQDAARKAQEMARDFQRRMQEFQEKVEQWKKNQNGKFPEMPKFPSFTPENPPHPRGPGSPRDVIREARPGGAPSVQRIENGTTTTWNTANANVTISDDDGEISVRSADGRRTLVAKDPAGKEIFNGAIDTEEQRRALPENIRRKLDRIDVRTHTGPHNPPPPPREGGERPPTAPEQPREIQ